MLGTAELNLRNLEIDLRIDVLRGKSGDAVRKEIAAHLPAYNLIRLLSWNAAREHGRDLRRLSFTGTLLRVRVMIPRLMIHPSKPRSPTAEVIPVVRRPRRASWSSDSTCWGIIQCEPRSPDFLDDLRGGASSGRVERGRSRLRDTEHAG